MRVQPPVFRSVWLFWQNCQTIFRTKWLGYNNLLGSFVWTSNLLAFCRTQTLLILGCNVFFFLSHTTVLFYESNCSDLDLLFFANAILWVYDCFIIKTLVNKANSQPIDWPAESFSADTIAYAQLCANRRTKPVWLADTLTASMLF